MKISSFVSIFLLGFSRVCRSDPLEETLQEPLGTGLEEYEYISLVSDLVADSLDALGGVEAIKNAIIAVVSQVGTEERRELSEVNAAEIFGENAEAAVSEVVEHWLDGLPGDGSRRRLQSGLDVVLDVVQFVLCTILSIFHTNILYSQVEDLGDYDDEFVCLEKDACPETSLETVKFVSENAKENEFLYHDKGPQSLQGVFWLNYAGFCSSMVSFAETVEASPLSTGELREPVFPLFPNIPLGGYTSNIRVPGASNWAFSGFSPCYFLVELIDLIYGIKPLRFLGNSDPIDDPKGFVVVPSIRIPDTDFRVALDSECSADVNGSVILRFEMKLIEDCNDIDTSIVPSGASAFAACNSGAVIWQRDTWFMSNVFATPSSTYYVIQIVDGCGKKTAAYSSFVEYESNAYWDTGLFEYGIDYGSSSQFRSLKKAKGAKSEKAAKTCKKEKRRFI